VDKLIYLTVTRPDISYSVNQISMFMHAPKISHLTVGKGIFIKNNNSNDVYGYFDADWDENFNRKSIIGFCTFISGNLITW
jgi:hypothetical protein